MGRKSFTHEPKEPLQDAGQGMYADGEGGRSFTCTQPPAATRTRSGAPSATGSGGPSRGASPPRTWGGSPETGGRGGRWPPAVETQQRSMEG